MKKRKRVRKFSRKADGRKAMLTSVARALFQKGKIETTEAKARAASSLAERLLTNAKRSDLSARRKLLEYFQASLVKKITEEIAPLYRERRGGYTRITKLGPRESDGAKMAILELLK